MKRILLLAACAAILASPAFAAGNSNNNGPTFGGTTNNNITNQGGQGGQGGAGGAGGAGGTGIGFGGAGGNAAAGAVAGAVAGASANNRNSVHNSVRSTNIQGQAQGQRQQATGGNAQGGSVNVAPQGDYRVTNQGTVTVRSAPDMPAPAVWSNNPCIISASGAVSVVGFGASVGVGVEDRDCTRRANAQLMSVMGYARAARELLCVNSEVRASFFAVGEPCAADLARVQSVSVTPTRAPESTPVTAMAAVRIAPAPVNTSGLSDDACATLRSRGMAVQGCP